MEKWILIQVLFLLVTVNSAFRLPDEIFSARQTRTPTRVFQVEKRRVRRSVFDNSYDLSSDSKESQAKELLAQLMDENRRKDEEMKLINDVVLAAEIASHLPSPVVRNEEEEEESNVADDVSSLPQFRAQRRKRDEELESIFGRQNLVSVPSLSDNSNEEQGLSESLLPNSETDENDEVDEPIVIPIWSMSAIAKRVPPLEFNVRPSIFLGPQSQSEEPSIFRQLQRRSLIDNAPPDIEENEPFNEEDDDLEQFRPSPEELKDILASNIYADSIEPPNIDETPSYLPIPKVSEYSKPIMVLEAPILGNDENDENEEPRKIDIGRKKRLQKMVDEPLKYRVVDHKGSPGLFIPLDQMKAKVLLNEMKKREQSDEFSDNNFDQFSSSVKKRSIELDDKLNDLGRSLAENDLEYEKRK